MSSKASVKEKYLFKPVSEESLIRFCAEYDFGSVYDDLPNTEPKSILCVVCEDFNISKRLDHIVFLSSKTVKYNPSKLNSVEDEVEYAVYDYLNEIASQSFLADLTRLISDEFGYDKLYKSVLHKFLISEYAANSRLLLVPVSNEFGIDFYTNNFDNVKFIFVQDNFIIPDENEKCHVMQMYDEFNPNHALISYYSCKSQDELEEQINSAIDKLVENDKLNIR